MQKENQKWNYITAFGTFLSKQEDFIAVENFTDDVGKVQREDGTRNYIDKNGNFANQYWI